MIETLHAFSSAQNFLPRLLSPLPSSTQARLLKNLKPPEQNATRDKAPNTEWTEPAQASPVRPTEKPHHHTPRTNHASSRPRPHRPEPNQTASNLALTGERTLTEPSLDRTERETLTPIQNSPYPHKPPSTTIHTHAQQHKNTHTNSNNAKCKCKKTQKLH